MNEFQISLMIIGIIQVVVTVVGIFILWEKYHGGAIFLSALSTAVATLLVLLGLVAATHWSDTPTEFTPSQWAAITAGSVDLIVCTLAISTGYFVDRRQSHQ